MDLEALIAEFKVITGRYDLTDAQITRYLNQGQLYLDGIYSRENSMTTFSTVLPAYINSCRIPNCVAVDYMGYRTEDTGDFTEIKRNTIPYKGIRAEAGYGHFYGVSFIGNLIKIDNTVEGHYQDFLMSGFKIGQTLSFYQLDADGNLSLDALPIVGGIGDPVITLVDSDQIQCDRNVPDAGAQCAIVGKLETSDEVVEDYFRFTELDTAKRINLFNIRSIIPSMFDGHIVFNKPFQENFEIQVLYQAVEPLVDLQDESWWSKNNPDILINAAAYKLEYQYRNMEGMREWKQAIFESMQSLYSFDTKRRKSSTQMMQDSFEFR